MTLLLHPYYTMLHPCNCYILVTLLLHPYFTIYIVAFCPFLTLWHFVRIPPERLYARGIVYLCTVHGTIIPAKVDKYARRICKSKSMRGTVFKPRRRQLMLVLYYGVQLVELCTKIYTSDLISHLWLEMCTEVQHTDWPKITYISVIFS